MTSRRRSAFSRAHDFSSLQGLQVVGDGLASSMVTKADAGQALALELEARAARFHQAVDASIVLANDGVIRWLGDPIAKLASGPDLLTPRAVILADSRLPEGARANVETRVELWLAALTRKLLGPLFSLRDLQDALGPGSGSGGKGGQCARRTRARRRAKPGQGIRSEFPRRAEKTGGPFRSLLHLRANSAQARRESAGAAALGASTCRRRFRRAVADSGADGVFRQDLAAIDQAIARDSYRCRRLSPVRRSRRSGRHRRAACGHDPCGVHSAGPGIGTSGAKRVHRQWPNDLPDGMLRGSIRVDLAIAWLRKHRDQAQRASRGAGRRGDAVQPKTAAATTAPEEPSRPETAPVEAETETASEPSADLHCRPADRGRNSPARGGARLRRDRMRRRRSGPGGRPRRPSPDLPPTLVGADDRRRWPP